MLSPVRSTRSRLWQTSPALSASHGLCSAPHRDSSRRDPARLLDLGRWGLPTLRGQVFHRGAPYARARTLAWRPGSRA